MLAVSPRFSVEWLFVWVNDVVVSGTQSLIHCYYLMDLYTVAVMLSYSTCLDHYDVWDGRVRRK